MKTKQALSLAIIVLLLIGCQSNQDADLSNGNVEKFTLSQDEIKLMKLLKDGTAKISLTSATSIAQEIALSLEQNPTTRTGSVRKVLNVYTNFAP